VAAVAFFILGAFIGYLLSGATGAAVATQTDLFGSSDEPASTPETTAEFQPAAPAPILNEEPTPAPVEQTDTAATEETDPVDVEVAVAEEPADTLDLNLVDTGSGDVAPTVPSDLNSAMVAPTWTVTLPFGMNFDPNRERVLSVNGVPVETREEFDVAIQSTVEPGDATTVALSIEVGTTDGDSVTQDVDVPVVHRSGFANGLEFETRHDGSLWQTRVSALPADNTLEIAVNDQILALLNTNEMVDGIDSLPTLLQRELASEADTLMFAVQRDGENWAVAVPTETLLAGAGG
jgi:hypothetical protein